MPQRKVVYVLHIHQKRGGEGGGV
jgi:hypothetical protein